MRPRKEKLAGDRIAFDEGKGGIMDDKKERDIKSIFVRDETRVCIIMLITTIDGCT